MTLVMFSDIAKNDATNRAARKLYMAAAVLFVIEMVAVLFSHI